MDNQLHNLFNKSNAKISIYSEICSEIKTAEADLCLEMDL